MPILLAALFLGAASASRAQELVDLTGEFADVQRANADRTAEQQAVAIREHFRARIPGFYELSRFGEDASRYEAVLSKNIADFPDVREQTLAAAARFRTMFPKAVNDFEKSFGPLQYDRPVYLLVSLGEFDGGMRTLPQGEFLLFGADMIAKYHGNHDLAPFFHHELFHVYHARKFERCDELWCSLWSEGLATHVAATLNPGSSDAELLLTIPEPIRPEIEKDRKPAVCAVRARLDSTRSEDMRALFSFERLGASIPPRAGYLIGQWVAQDVGKTRSLEELATMGGESLRSEIAASLDRMADCSA